MCIQWKLSIDRSYFGNNCAFQGGVLNSFLNSSIEIHDSEFGNNEAISDKDPFNSAGGVICMMQSSTLNIIRTHVYSAHECWWCFEYFLKY